MTNQLEKHLPRRSTSIHGTTSATTASVTSRHNTPPCNFRFCQSNLQAGIVKSVLQRQRREHFKGIRYILYPNQNDVRIFPSAKILFSIPQNYIENPQP